MSSETEKPYMFLSHYSTPGIVLYYLIRKVPSYILKVQNEGYGGPPDRIFYNISMSYFNGLKVLADNKELIPEFYFGDGSFLVNYSQVELGLNHLEEKVDHVQLPQWAQNAQEFIIKNRQALESNYVSANLNKWIDLTFGYLQKGEKAQIANNLFQPYTLEENVDFTQISSPLERQALEAQIRNFGQCPLQIFTDSSHSERFQRVIYLNQQIVGNNQVQQNKDVLQQELQEARLEIIRLREEIEEASKQSEENLMRQMQEFKQLDEIRKKKITRYKDEGEKQLEKYRQMVEILKNKQVTIKSEVEQKFQEREQQYIQIIESLKQQLQHQNSQPIPKNLAQLNTFIEKHPGGIEYLKTLDTNNFSKDINNNNNKAQRIVKKIENQLSMNSQGNRIGSQAMSQSKIKQVKAGNQ